MNIYEKFKKEAMDISKEIIKNRRYIHQNPEIGLELPNTQQFVMEKLIEMGYEPEKCGAFNATGVVATVGGRSPGKVFLIRADMDALPIYEESESEYKSKNNYMHACGHDAHTAMLLGTAKILKKYEDEIPGSVKLMFQPGEEVLKGAKAMIDDGLLENPTPDAALMLHTTIAEDKISDGDFILPQVGFATSGSHTFKIDIKGLLAHCSTPQNAIDAAHIATHINLGLQSINSKDLSLYSQEVLNVGRFVSEAGISSIPGEAVLEGTFRTYNPEDSAIIEKRIKEISYYIAKAYKGEAEAKIKVGGPHIVNDAKLHKLAQETVKELFDEVVWDWEEITGHGAMTPSDDFGWLSKTMPTLMMMISLGGTKDGFKYPLHHPKVSFSDAKIYKGSAFAASLAFKWLEINK